MAVEPAATATFSIPRLRNWILTALVLGVILFTSVMFGLSNNLSRRFGPEVQVDLEWRVLRGAQELARSADLALAISDAALVQQSFGPYTHSDDVQAIVAIDATGELLAQHGRSPEPVAQLFSGKPGTIRQGKGYLVSWAEAQIEGAPVGRLAVVVSTKRLADTHALLNFSSNTALGAGLAALILGSIVVTFFTRVVGQRDAQLSNYAHNLESMVEQRTAELDERNRGMRLVLDNVAQGFITIDAEGVMASERSAAVDRWFGTPRAGATLASYLGERAGTFGGWLDIGLAQLRDGFLPAELTIDQLPKRFVIGARTYQVGYNPIGSSEPITRMLVIISDITELLAHERAEAEQKELVALFRRLASDRTGVEEFLTEAASMVGALRQETDPVVQKRLVHTLKGNCAVYGLETYAEIAHGVESDLATTEGVPLNAEQRTTLVSAWKQAMQRIGWLLGGGKRDVLEVERSEYELLLAQIRNGMPLDTLIAELTNWKWEPVERRLDRLGQQASALAVRLGKPAPSVEIQGNRVRLDPQGWGSFWSALVHVARNAVDHGIESPEARVLAGKPEAGTLTLSSLRQNGQMIISMRDDGRGIDWERVRQKAMGMQLPHATQADLINALFSDGLSTRDEVSAISGRGVGLGAVRQAVLDLGGSLEVESVPGHGATWRFVFDENRAALSAKGARVVVNSSLMPASAL